MNFHIFKYQKKNIDLNLIKLLNNLTLCLVDIQGLFYLIGTNFYFKTLFCKIMIIH